MEGEGEQVKAHSGEKHWEKAISICNQSIQYTSKRDEMIPNP